MHPATKAHICGMLETVRHALKSIETAIAVDSNQGEVSQHPTLPTKSKESFKPMQDDDSPFTTEEEDNEIGRRFSLIGVDQVDSGGEI